MLYFTSSATLVWLLTVCPECSCSSLDRSAATWPYFAGFEATSLVASATHESSTSWPCWYLRGCEAKPHRTSQKNASSLPTTLGAVIFVLSTPASAPSRGPVLDWATEVSLSLDHESGTVYPALCDNLTWTLGSSNNNCWRHFCLSETAAHLWRFVFLLMRRVSFRNPILDLDMALTVGWDWRCSVGLELMLRHFSVWSGSGQRQYDIGVSVPVSNNSGSCVKGVVDKAILTVDSVSGRRTSVVTMETETCLTVISARSEGRPWEQRRPLVITAVDWRDSGKFCSHFLFIYVILLYIIAVLL